MRRRSEIISMGLSIAIVAVLLAQLIPTQSPPSRTLPKASTPAPMTPPKPIALAAVPLPAPPPAPMSAPVLTVTAPEAAPELVTPLKPTPKAAATPEKIVKTVEPLRKTANTRLEKVVPLKVEPIKPVKTVAMAPAKPIIPLKKPETIPSAPRPVAVKPVQAPTPQTVGTTDTTPLMASGRPLLRLLEHGDGPSIDIAWPHNTRGREALFQSFAECYGMLVALMATNGDLYSDRDTSGPWQINRDRYSGFVRQSGALGTIGERAWSRRILHRHPRAAGSTTIRVFPRAMDALLIGGLSRLLGEDYRAAKSIGARYVQTGNAILIDDIVADGLPVAGRIDLTAAGSRRCRASVKPKGI
jgi:hypothetical protein